MSKNEIDHEEFISKILQFYNFEASHYSRKVQESIIRSQLKYILEVLPKAGYRLIKN